MKRNRTEPAWLEPENKIQIERVILAVYLFHTVSLSAAIAALRWNYQILVPLVIGLAACIYIHVIQYKTYTFRAYFTTVMLWGNMAAYGLITDDFIGLLLSMVAVLVILGLYALPGVFRIGMYCYTALVLIHLIFLRDIRISATREGMRVLMRILSVYLIELIVRYLIKTQQDTNRRLLANIESLKKAERAKDDFMANVSHEIRTPVNTICGMSEILLAGDLPEEAQNEVFGIQTAGRNLLSAVSDILDFSELESGKTEILPDAYSITSLVNDIINSANAKNSGKNLELVVDCAPDMPEQLIGDRQKIFRAILNIIDNAIKFTQEGGVVFSMHFRREYYGGNLCIVVKDTGAGIRPEQLEKIFTGYNQADTKRNRTEGGIGLGLAISRAIVSKMGGFLNVRSVYGEGCEVSLVIPQKVGNEAPCISVENPEDVHILIYLVLDKYKYPLIRDGYRKTMEHMITKFRVSAVLCRRISDVKRRLRDENVTHLFLGWEEYLEDRDFFEAMSEKLQITLVIDRRLRQEVENSHLLCIYAPFYALSIASILNGETVRDISETVHRNRFTAPEAHVLVVDDNRMNLKVAEGLLRPYRIRISTALSGKEALKMVESHAYDFIFMDHMMPEMDGVETFRRIREKGDAYCKNVPVIALTANAVGNAREMFLSEGFADYVSKPIEMSAMEHVLRKFIPAEKIVYAGREINLKKTKESQSRAGRAEQKKNLGGLAKAVKKGAALAAQGSVGSEARNAQRGEAGDFAGASDMPGFSKEAEQLLDVETGICYCGGSMQDYLEILQIYYEGGKKNIRGIRDALAKRDWKQFALLAHTVKGTSRSIGARKLPELALDLERAGKEQKTENIELRTETMLAEYGRVLEALGSSPAVFPEGNPADAVRSSAAAAASDEPACGAKACGAAAFAGTGVTDGAAGAAGARGQAASPAPAEETCRSEAADRAEAAPAGIAEEEFRILCRSLNDILDCFDSDAAETFRKEKGGLSFRGAKISELLADVFEKAGDFDFIGAQEALEAAQEDARSGAPEAAQEDARSRAPEAAQEDARSRVPEAVQKDAWSRAPEAARENIPGRAAVRGAADAAGRKAAQKGAKS